MTTATVLLVLCAALLHATWNALLKSGGDRLRSITVMTGAASVASAPALFVLPFPLRASWPAIALSCALHVGYNLFLVRSYKHGDLGQVYPIARGSSPVLVLLGALLVAGERPGWASLMGIALVSGGILSLARGWGRAAGAGLWTALTTGAFIAAYTVTDGLGGRLAGDPVAYALWLFLVDGIPMAVIYTVLRRRTGPRLVVLDPATGWAALGGVVSLVAYTVVIWAASVGPMGPVSALRETSVVFAALIGWLFLGERLTWRRLGSCLVVAAGAVVLGGHP